MYSSRAFIWIVGGLGFGWQTGFTNIVNKVGEGLKVKMYSLFDIPVQHRGLVSKLFSNNTWPKGKYWKKKERKGKKEKEKKRNKKSERLRTFARKFSNVQDLLKLL